MHSLLSAWSVFNPEQSPFVLPGDEGLLEEQQLLCRFAGWDNFVAHPEFGAPRNSQFHVDLLPIPFIGDLKSASVIFLMLNPGLGPHDYFGEYQVPDYRAALLNNLRQEKNNSFLFLDPRFSWHGGFNYWHGKLQSTIGVFAKETGASYGQARQYFQSQIAVIQLVPYHSSKFSIPARVLDSLRSVQLSRSFVHEEVLPRARSSECLVVATRALRHWQISEQKNVACYTGAESRSAHLGPESRGGSSMLHFLIGKYRADRSP